MLDGDNLIITGFLGTGKTSAGQEIARRLGNVTARTVTNRIDNLVDQGIIHIRSIVNPDKVGYSMLAYVFIEVEPGNLRRVAEHLDKLPQISYVAFATGETDIVTKVRARNIQELYDFVIEVLGKIPGVRHTQTYPLPLNIKSSTTWMPPDILKDREIPS